MVDLRQPCKFCGKTLRKHCFAIRCKLIWTFCNARIAAVDPIWTSDRQVDFRCLKCGDWIKNHYSHAQPSVQCFGELIDPGPSEVIFLLPEFMTGCPSSFHNWFYPLVNF